MRVATEARARCLALFHHDPARDDDALDRILEHARATANGAIGEVLAAHEGLTIAYDRP